MDQYFETINLTYIVDSVIQDGFPESLCWFSVLNLLLPIPNTT